MFRDSHPGSRGYYFIFIFVTCPHWMEVNYEHILNGLSYHKTFRPQLQTIIEKHWDLFSTRGIFKSICRLKFHVYMGIEISYDVSSPDMNFSSQKL